MKIVQESKNPVQTVLLGDVAQIISGQSPQSSNYNKDGDGLPLYQGKKDFGAMFTAEPTVWTTQTTKVAEKGDVLISVRAPVGPINFASQRMNIGRGLAAIRPWESLDPKYLYLFMKLNELEIAKLGGGATFDSINRDHLKNLEIPLPPIGAQRRVVKKLDEAFEKIDKAIELTQKNLQNSQDLFDATLRELLDNSDGPELSLNEFMTLNYGKGLDRKDRDPNGKFNVYGANGVKDKADKFLWEEPSIIVGRKGSAGEVNLTDGPFWPLDVTYYVEHDPSKTDLMFLFYLLKTLNLPSLANGVKPGINRNDVYSISVKLPHIADQQKIVKKLHSLSEQTKKLQKLYRHKLDDLQELKKSLLNKAFKGEL